MFVSKLAKRQADTTQTTTQDTVDTGEIRHNASIPTTINPLSSILNIVSHAKKPAEPSPIQHVAPTLQNGPVGFVLQGTNLKYFNKVIPDPLRARFFDIRALYSQPLYDYLSKKKKHPGNISMKLKHLGIDARGIKLYIVIQCEKRVSKKVKKFFLQENVADDLSPDFLVLVLDKPPVEIANEDAIDVLSNSVPDKTICGMPITLIGGGKSVSCTLGGTIIATTDQRRIYGLIAGHPLKKLRGDSSGKQPTYEVPGSTLEDEEEDSDSDETSTDTSVTSLESLHSDIETTNADDRLREKHHIGTVVYDSFNTQSGKNYDWALVDLRQEYALPNVAPQNRHANDSYFGKEFYRNHAGSFSTVFTEQVLVLKPDKPQMAELFLNNSSLVMSPGCKFVHVHDVVMKDGSSLSPGDSGLWVLDAKTLCLYGHIVSVDAFGETQVMPIHSTFQSIAWELEATEVYLPTSKDIQSLKAPRELSLSFTQPEPPAPVSKLTPASIVSSDKYSLPERLPWEFYSQPAQDTSKNSQSLPRKNRKTQKFDHEPDDAA